MDLNIGWYVRDFLCAHTQEWEGLVVPGTERHARLFKARIRVLLVRTHSLRQLWLFITRENASLARLISTFCTCGI